MPPWLIDSTVVVAMVTVLGGLFSTIITTSANRKDQLIKHQYEDIKEVLSGLIDKVKTIDDTTTETKKISEITKDGTLKIQRYRLFHDLTKEISQGYTTIEHFRELSILFESYQLLGGNGEIEALFEKFKQLPIEEN